MARHLALAYVTGTILHRDAAHARQIDAMCRAFTARLGDEFALFRPAEGDPSHPVVATRAFGTRGLPRAARQILVASRTASDASLDRSTLVFAREFAVAAALWAAGAKIVLELHQLPRAAVLSALRRIAPRPRWTMLTISRQLETDLRRALPAAGDLCAYHDGVFPEDYTATAANDPVKCRAELGLPLHRPVAMYTGSLYKGADAKSLRQLAAIFPEVEFVLVGGDGRLLQELRGHYAGLTNVRFLGQRDAAETRRLQAAADILMLPLTRSNPLWRHTSPLKLFEYMAAGRTIVASNIGAVGEVVDETTAFVFDGDDLAAMTDAFARALTAPQAERAAKIARCRQLVEDRYNWRSRVDFILDRWRPESCRPSRPATAA